MGWQQSKAADGWFGASFNIWDAPHGKGGLRSMPVKISDYG
jgi:hypothetical protein